MKRKVTRIGNTKDILERLKGIAVFRVTGPCELNGNKVTIEFTGTRLQAERVPLRSVDNEKV